MIQSFELDPSLHDLDYFGPYQDEIQCPPLIIVINRPLENCRRHDLYYNPENYPYRLQHLQSMNIHEDHIDIADVTNGAAQILCSLNTNGAAHDNRH